MSSPDDPGRPGQGWTSPAWGQPSPQQPSPQQPGAPQWEGQPQPLGWGTPPTLVAPAQAAQPPSAPPPPPPVPLVVAAGLTLLAVVAVVVAAVVGGPGDLLADAGWLPADADAVPALLAGPLVAALIGGAGAALAGRGGGLLLVAGVSLAVLAAAVAVGSGLTDDVQGVRLGLAAATAVVGALLAVLAVLAPSQRWYRSAERRSAERVVERVLAQPAGGRDQVAGSGTGWAVAAAVLAVATVGATALVLAGVDGDGAEDGRDGFFGSGSGPAPIPVDESDSEYDSTFHELAEGCRDGDLDACDSLYFQTPVGSEYEEYGSTCGGRADEEFYGTCAEDFD